MKSLILSLALVLGGTSLAVAPLDVEAKRLGGGRPSGLQRQMPAQPAAPKPAAAPDAQKAPGMAAQPGAAAAAGAAQQAGRRSWLGPIAGLAAGLGLAALFSHLGLGAGLANFVTLLLLAVVGFVAVRWVMRRMGAGAKPALAGAGAGAGAGGGMGAGPASGAAFGASAPWAGREALPAARPGPASPAVTMPPASAAAVSTPLPEGVDEQDFLRLAKQVFVRLQAAHDAGDLDDLRRFTTPELFASVKTDLLERGAQAQKTDVVQLDAAIADTARDAGRDLVSVRFNGLIREQADAGAEPFDELWHLERSADGAWRIAGIQPLNA